MLMHGYCTVLESGWAVAIEVDTSLPLCERNDVETDASSGHAMPMASEQELVSLIQANRRERKKTRLDTAFSLVKAVLWWLPRLDSNQRPFD